MSGLFKHSRNGVSMAKKIPICEPVNLRKYFTARYIQRWTLVSTYLGADNEKSQGGGGELFPSHENVFVPFSHTDVLPWHFSSVLLRKVTILDE